MEAQAFIDYMQHVNGEDGLANLSGSLCKGAASCSHLEEEAAAHSSC